MKNAIKELIKLSTSAPAIISGKREVLKSLFVNNINNLTDGEFNQFISELNRKNKPNISIYNFAHGEFKGEDCCGIFDILDDDGMIICNECNEKLRDVVNKLWFVC